jgi:hypothetical protein
MENGYIQKYKEYIAFLRANQDDLLDNDNWDSLFSVLQFLRLSDEYTLDDYRSKKSTDNILRLYARKVETKRPAETEFEKIDFGNFVQRWLKAVLAENENAENTTVKLPERIEPESVVTLDFTPEAIWDAYLLKTTDYYIGQRWHGGYHEMAIPANIDELKKFRPWKEDEKPKYEKFIEETEFDFAPKITIDGDVATIEHIAVFFHNRFSKCCATVHYDRKTRKIDEFKFESTDIFKFSQRFYF